MKGELTGARVLIPSALALPPHLAHPQPHTVIHLRDAMTDVTRGVRYALEQCLSLGRGRIEFDSSRGRVVVILPLDQTDRDIQILFRQQRAKKLWLVLKPPQADSALPLHPLKEIIL